MNSTLITTDSSKITHPVYQLISSRYPFIHTTSYYSNIFLQNVVFRCRNQTPQFPPIRYMGASLATVAQYPLVHNRVNNRLCASSGRNNYTLICKNKESKKNQAVLLEFLQSRKLWSMTGRGNRQNRLTGRLLLQNLPYPRFRFCLYGKTAIFLLVRV